MKKKKHISLLGPDDGRLWVGSKNISSMGAVVWQPYSLESCRVQSEEDHMLYDPNRDTFRRKKGHF